MENEANHCGGSLPEHRFHAGQATTTPLAPHHAHTHTHSPTWCMVFSISASLILASLALSFSTCASLSSPTLARMHASHSSRSTTA